MKKRVSVLLAFSMLVAVMTGCTSDASKNYLNMCKEVQSYDGISSVGTLKFEVDNNVMNEYIQKIAASNEVRTDVVMPGASREIKHFPNTQFDYNLQTTIPKGNKLNLTGTVKYNDKSFDVDVKVLGEKAYISVDTLIGFVNYSENFAARYNSPYLTEALEDMKQNDSVKYIIVGSGISEEPEELFEDTDEQKKLAELKKQLAVEAFTEVFDSIDVSNIVSGDTVKSKIDGSLKDIMNVAFKLYGVVANTDEVKISSFDEMLEDMRTNDVPEEDIKITSDIFNNSKINIEAERVSNAIEQSSEVVYKLNEDKMVFKVAAKSRLSNLNGKINIEVPQYGCVNEDCVSDKLIMFDAKHNPVKRVEIDWVNTDISNDGFLCGISSFHQSGKLASAVSDIYLIENRIYLPLRKICERSGLEVSWDGSKAHVIVNGTNVEMDGKIINDRTFVKVRDFEKLGVKVDYVEPDKSDKMYAHVAILTFE